MKFDKNAPGGGVSARCTLENGKVTIEWQIAVVHDSLSEKVERIAIRLRDIQGTVVLECIQDLEEEEPLVSVVLQPRLWNGLDSPYLYQLEAVLEDYRGNCLERLVRQFPLRCIELRRMPGEDEEKIFLNGTLFRAKAVEYELPVREAANESERQICSQVLKDLEYIVATGANCICLRGEKTPSYLTEFCETRGLLAVVYIPGKLIVDDVTVHVDKDRTLEEYLGEICRDITSASGYYQYKARWSKVPFVYILPESLRRQKNGNYMVMCYSNCKRVALYVDGKLFEFQHGMEIFTFEEIPVKGPCIVLAAEGEGCSTSFSVHKTFTKLSPIDDN